MFWVTNYWFLDCKNRLAIFPSPANLVSDILAGDRKTANLFLQCNIGGPILESEMATPVKYLFYLKIWIPLCQKTGFPLREIRTIFPKAEFLDVVGTKVLKVFLLAIHSHLY